MEALARWFADLHERTGINLVVFYDPFDAARFFRGVLLTVEMAALCIVASVLIGAVGAWLQGSRWRCVRALVNAYVELVRNTPSMIQLYFLFFGLGPYIAAHNAHGQAEPLISGFTWAVVCFSFYTGAFNTETFRAGIDAVPRQTEEAAESLGYTRLGAYLYVVLPLALRISFPALSNNLVNLIKMTSVAYAIAVPEILYVSNQIWSDALNVPEMMNVVLVSYVLLVSGFNALMARIERRLRVPGLGC
ncbi:amino acid ABC transporter permease [Pseudothauera rhizosphaerae]|uniref:Amino acid ABC transporter permease n=2 Tax=Pseudothauera rhizosphaerae TaxID=2565932 RepID=A0A4S4ARA9_9RHOO|nr:amino acid ABC transporter permease [Pseudothauera rhizosphaerae]